MSTSKDSNKPILKIPKVSKNNRKKGAKQGAMYGAAAGGGVVGYRTLNSIMEMGQSVANKHILSAKDSRHGLRRAPGAVKLKRSAVVKLLPHLGKMVALGTVGGASAGGLAGYTLGKNKTQQVKNKYLEKISHILETE